MATTTQDPGARGSIEGAGTDSSMHESVPFTSACPRCTREQPQRGFTRATLQRLLDVGYPIEAYCVMCDQFWPVSADVRQTIVDALAR
jgi:hypothetical protein